MKTLDDFKSMLRKEYSFLQKRFHISSLGIFGSYVRHEQKIKSDLDLLVEFNQPVTLFDIVDLEEYLSSKMNIKVDIVMKQALKKRTGEKILREVISL